MRTVGLLGGMSWESSVAYERIINTEVRRRLGGVHSADLIVRSYDFATIEALQRENRWDDAAVLLARDAQRLEHAGAQAIVLCTNTMHVLAEQIAAAVSVPLLHIADVTARAAREREVSRPGLLGTAYTMEQPFLVDRLTAHGLDVVVPDGPDRNRVHTVIYAELVRGLVREESRRAYRSVVERLVERGADGIIAGCTEIELLLTADDVPVPYLPTTTLHAMAAVEFMLNPSGAPAGPPPP